MLVAFLLGRTFEGEPVPQAILGLGALLLALDLLDLSSLPDKDHLAAQVADALATQKQSVDASRLYERE